MLRANLLHAERARRLLAHEASADTEADASGAVARVFDKLEARLSPLIGAAGVEAAFLYSAKRACDSRAVPLCDPPAANAHQLRATLRTLDAAAAASLAQALLEGFFALVGTFVGERLITEALRSVWPRLDGANPTNDRDWRK